MALRVINIMKDGRVLDSLAGIDAPEVIYDILLKDYRAKGIKLVPIQTPANKPAGQAKEGGQAQ